MYVLFVSPSRIETLWTQDLGSVCSQWHTCCLAINSHWMNEWCFILELLVFWYDWEINRDDESRLNKVETNWAEFWISCQAVQALFCISNMESLKRLNRKVPRSPVSQSMASEGKVGVWGKVEEDWLEVKRTSELLVSLMFEIKRTGIKVVVVGMEMMSI